MVPRVGSALLALGATVLLAVSIASTWWDGLPTVNGHLYSNKTLAVTLFAAQGCNVGGNESCQKIKLSGGFAAQEYIEVGAIGLLGVSVLVLGVLAATGSGRRRTFAKVAMAAAGAGAIVAVALMIQGPQIAEGKLTDMPLGDGMKWFGVGALCAIVAGVVALLPQTRRQPVAQVGWTPQPIPQMQMQQMPPPQPQQPVDVLALLQDDTLRPAALGPEPMWRNGAPASPGGALPGPSVPLGVPSPPPPQQSPLFQAAPQLRPLYEAAPNQGGTGGFVPQPPVPLPMRPPTPVPRDAISAMAGIPTPPMIEAQRPPAPPPRTLPPPNRSKSQSVAPPPIPPRTTGATKPPPLRTAQPTSIGLGTVPAPSVPFPAPPPRKRLETDPVEVAQTVEREKPLDPAVDPGGAVNPVDPIADTFDPNATSLPTGTFDGGATLARPGGESTDVGIVPINDGTASQQFELPTSESPSFAAAPRPDTDLGEVDPPAEPPPPAVDDASPDSGPHTVPAKSEVPAGPRPSAVMAAANVSLPPPPAARSTGAQPTASPPRTTGTMPATKTGAMAAAAAPTKTGAMPAAAPGAAKPPTGQIQIPISTAPETLPPPSPKQATTSGPSPACPQCEAPMAWVEEHLRFYCKSCKMYF